MMPKFRYNLDGNWYKGNTHIHSTRSDGGKTKAELSRMYAAEGYDFLVHADHWVASDVAGEGGDWPILWLDGIELHGHDHGGSMYHVVCIGTFHGLQREKGLVAAMELARAQGGLMIMAHPHWLDNTLEDALRYGFHGVEIYNHVCRWLNGKGDGTVHWNAMLQRDPNTLGFAVDDAHIRPEHPGWNGAWIKVNARALTREALLESMRAGNFYSTCGPDFLQIAADGRQVRIETTPVQFIRLVGPAHQGRRIGSFDDQHFTEATFEVPEDWPYAYVEIEDEGGHRAWTNTLFPSEATEDKE